jgi:hypothetical protein
MGKPLPANGAGVPITATAALIGCSGEDLASFQIHNMHRLTCEAGHRLIACLIRRHLIDCAGLGAAVEDRNHLSANAADQQ